jgi:glutathione synthase/RimK-type ligase-like ATP-grasp enzyme
VSPTCLVVTHSRDRLVPDWVLDSLAQRGATGRRIDIDRYPGALSLQLFEGASAGRSQLDGLPLAEVRGAYLRKLVGPLLPADLPAEARGPLRREVQHHVRGMVDALEAAGARVVNDPAASVRVDNNKPLQLRVARSVGLAVPDTLVTNDPGAVRAFHARHGGAVVVKLLSGFDWSLDASTALPTRLLTAEDLDHLDGLRAGPMCFQERIRAPVELRVTWVAGRAFCGAQRMGDTVDWRATGSGWIHGALPEGTLRQVGALMDRLGLVMGSLDLMLPEHGPPVFLEVNPAGEWGMLQGELGHDISGAIADALLERP